jgi:hypothetical protein
MKVLLAAGGSKFTKKALAFLVTHESLAGPEGRTAQGCAGKNVWLFAVIHGVGRTDWTRTPRTPSASRRSHAARSNVCCIAGIKYHRMECSRSLAWASAACLPSTSIA